MKLTPVMILKTYYHVAEMGGTLVDVHQSLLDEGYEISRKNLYGRIRYYRTGLASKGAALPRLMRCTRNTGAPGIDWAGVIDELQTTED